MVEVKRLLRTAQNAVPFSARMKYVAYHYGRKYLRIAHERDFAVVRLLPRSSHDLFLDVGANRGQSILSMRAYRRDVRIVAFEPNAVIYRQLARRFRDDPLLKLRNFGLGTRDETATLYVPTYRGFRYDGNASFDRKVAEEYLCPKTLYFFDPSLAAIQGQICALKCLDGLNLAPSFVKIDVEGFEREVLAGGQEMLRRHEPAVMFERQYSYDAVVELLAPIGYEPVTIANATLVKGDTAGLNVIMMTPRRFRDCCRPFAAR